MIWFSCGDQASVLVSMNDVSILYFILPRSLHHPYSRPVKVSGTDNEQSWLHGWVQRISFDKNYLWSIYLLTYKVIQLCCPRKLHVIKCFLLNHISFALCLVLMSYTSLELILLAKISRQLFGDVWRSRPFFLWKWCWMLDSHLHRLILYSNTLPSPPLFEWTCMFVFFFVLHSQQMPLNLTGMTEPPFFL